jgi:starvation-inducible outer membrane lipoprotein
LLMVGGCSTAPVSTSYSRKAIVETNRVEQPSRKIVLRITRSGGKLVVSKEAADE